MTWTKMSTVPNPIIVDAAGTAGSGYVLKVYSPGTTTAISIATDSTGGTTVASMTANSEGKWEVSGNEYVPHIDRKCKWGIFANSTDAAANTPFYMGPFDNVEQSASGEDTTTDFANVAAMVASTTLSVGDIVRTLGYFTEGDGGDNTYKIVAAATGTDDGGSYIDLATHQAQGLFPGGLYNVKQFGAKFDGSTDDTTAIINALNSGASVVKMPAGHAGVSSVITVPDFVSLVGSGTSTVASTLGTTLLYSGTGECIRSAGTQDVVPFIKSGIGNFRIRKTTQASTLAAVALISGAGVIPVNIRVDTDSNAYNFKYGFVFDQSEVVGAKDLDVQGSTSSGVMTAAYFLTNGPEYTAGNSTNFTNAVTLINCNANSADYGVLHDGGEGFKIIGGNLNGSHTASMRLSGLNSFCIDAVYMEGSSGTADVLIEQTTSGAVSVGAGGGGTIKNCRMASTTTNCIKFNNSSIQATGFNIYGNKFGSGRTGSAISVAASDSLRGSRIGRNVNLGGASKRYLDADIYTSNEVAACFDAQSEPNLNTVQSGKRKISTAYTRVTGSPYVVLDTDQALYITNNAGVDQDLTLPSGADEDGRELEIYHVLGNDPINVTAGVVLAGAGASCTIRYNHALTQWQVLSQEATHSTTAALESVSNQINTKASKVEGFKVFNETTGLYVVAAGNANGSVWVYEGTGNTAHTPV